MQRETKRPTSLKADCASTELILQNRTTQRNSDNVSANSQKAENLQVVRKNMQMKTLKRKRIMKVAGKENCGNNNDLKKNDKETKNVSFHLKEDGKQHGASQSTLGKADTKNQAAGKQRVTLSSHKQHVRKMSVERPLAASMVTSTQIQLPVTGGKNKEPSIIPNISSDENKDMHATTLENTSIHIPYEPRSTFLKNIKLQTRSTNMLMDPGNQRPIVASKTPDQYPWRNRLQNIPSRNFHNNITGKNSVERTLIRSRERQHASERPVLPETAEAPSRVPPLLGYDWIAGLIDNEAVDTTKKSKAWFDEMKDFRRLNWFECHAHKLTDLNDSEFSQLDIGLNAQRFPPEDSRMEMDFATSSRDLLHRGQKYHPHKCIHHFRINSRLFTEPVLQDGEGNSLCPICLTSRPRFNLDFQDQQRNRSPPVDVRVTVPTALLQGSVKNDVKNIIGSKSKPEKQGDNQNLGSTRKTVDRIKRQSYETHSRLWKNRRIQGAWPPLLVEKPVPKAVSYPVEDSLALRHQKFSAIKY